MRWTQVTTDAVLNSGVVVQPTRQLPRLVATEEHVAMWATLVHQGFRRIAVRLVLFIAGKGLAPVAMPASFA